MNRGYNEGRLEGIMVNFIVKNKKYIGYIVLALFYFIVLLCLCKYKAYIDEGDFAIKYWGAHGMHNGYKLYNDINIIVPPISYLLSYIAIGIYDSYLSIFILTSLIWLGIFYYNHEIAAYFKTNQFIVIILNLLVPIFNSIYGSLFYDYNIVAALFCLGSLYYILCKDYNLKYCIIIALFLICAIWTKQSTGVFYFIAALIAMIIKFRKEKKFIKNSLIMVLVGLLFSSIIICSLLITNTFNSFMDLCVWGIFKFSENTAYTQMTCTHFVQFFITFAAGYLIIKNKYFDKNTFILVLFLITSLTVCYPIFSVNHSSTYGIFLVPVFICAARKISTKKTFIYFLLLLVGLIIVLINRFSFSSEEVIVKIEDGKFKDLKCNSGYYIAYKEIEKYMEANPDKDFYIIDKSATGLCCLFDINNGYYNFLWNGNIGTKSIDEYMQELDLTGKFVIAVDYSYQLYGYDNKKIYAYIEEKCNFIETLHHNDYDGKITNVNLFYGK